MKTMTCRSSEDPATSSTTATTPTTSSRPRTATSATRRRPGRHPPGRPRRDEESLAAPEEVDGLVPRRQAGLRRHGQKLTPRPAPKEDLRAVRSGWVAAVVVLPEYEVGPDLGARRAARERQCFLHLRRHLVEQASHSVGSAGGEGPITGRPTSTARVPSASALRTWIRCARPRRRRPPRGRRQPRPPPGAPSGVGTTPSSWARRPWSRRRRPRRPRPHSPGRPRRSARPSPRWAPTVPRRAAQIAGPTSSACISRGSATSRWSSASMMPVSGARPGSRRACVPRGECRR